MRRRRILSVMTAGVGAGIAGCLGFGGSGDGSAGPDADGPPRLTVDGRWLTGPTGDRVVLRGVSVPDPLWGTENAERRGKDYWETLRLATDESAGWHGRILRIPVRPRSVEREGVDAIASEYLDRAVSLAADRGVYALIDYHRIGRYDTAAADDAVRSFWDAVAPRYADNSHVLYELFNEPTEPAGGGIDAWRTWRDHAEPWVDLVREAAPDTPVVVGSPRWSSMLRYAVEEPFADDNVVYAAHVYPSWDPTAWEPTFGDPALDVPVFVTEWGYVGRDGPSVDSHLVGRTSSWGRPFRQWLDAHTNVSWCARAFDSVRQPSMFADDWSLRGGEDFTGELVKEWLADSRDDHWPPADPDGETVTPRPTGSPPGPPRTLRAERIGETTAVVEWSSASDHDGDVIVQYRVGLRDREPTPLSGTERSLEITGLSPGATYRVTATAVDATGRESREVETSFTTVEPVAARATIPRTTSPPAIDGAVDDVWDGATAHSIDRFLWGDEQGTIDGEWRALWDDSALYYLVSVRDPDAWTDSETAWQDDGVEVYLDLDNSRGETYDGENDMQLLVRRGEDFVRGGTNSVAVPSGVSAASMATDDGWRVELSVPWEPFDVDPITGHRFGTDVQLVDDEDGGERDAKYAWHDEDDDAWENPSTFAVVELGE